MVYLVALFPCAAAIGEHKSGRRSKPSHEQLIRHPSFVSSRYHKGSPAHAAAPGQKPSPLLPLEQPVSWAFQDVTLPWPQWILFGQVDSSYFNVRESLA